MIRSPMRWVGGKSKLRKTIVPMLPKHTCYVEPFAGAAWILFAKEPSQVEVLNDADQELINFWSVVKECPDKLIESFEWELVSRARFDGLAKMDPNSMDPVSRAHRFYYLIMAGWGGEFRHPRFQTSITDAGGHGNRLVGAIESLRSRLLPVHLRLKTVIVECLDWRACVARYDRPGTVMYVDPPYPENGVGYRLNEKGAEFHQELHDWLKNAKCQWILSTYDKPEIRKSFKWATVTPVSFASGMDTAKGSGARLKNQEILVSNFLP